MDRRFASRPAWYFSAPAILEPGRPNPGVESYCGEHPGTLQGRRRGKKRPPPPPPPRGLMDSPG
jgi:hypothetical protein